MDFFRIYFDFLGIFRNYFFIKNCKKGCIFAQDTRSWCGAVWARGGATQAHADACVAPTWRVQWQGGRWWAHGLVGPS